MFAKWKNGFDPKVILGKLSEIRKLEGSSVSFSGFEYIEYIAVLKSMVEISADVSTEIGYDLVVKGFHEAAKKQQLEPDSVLSAIKKAVRAHYEKPNHSYHLLTTLNINNSNNLPKYSIGECALKFHQALPKKYKTSRNQAISEVASWLIDKDEPSSYYVTAHTYARNENDAVNKMLDAIDLLRGIWNLHINKAMSLSFGGRKKPINQITLGALHTVHKDDGSKEGNGYWYEPEYHENQAKVDFSKNSYKTLMFTKNVRKKLHGNPYGKGVEVAIVRYARALDSQNYNTAYIRLWSILEYLTSTLHDSYDKTIKRTSFLYKDREYVRQVLEHLRQYRNKSVHSGTGEHDIDIRVYQLKGYVEELLRFHIANHYKFDSLQEAAKFMDLNPEKENLKKQIALCKAGIKFMGG